ncbi:unnamed protein product [Lactuca virosa]|uniref:Uncharacterized protein n=1 Tax=Lactuca virosa TaxID=75947 RepID=A0AAU9MSI7_9ASTR|nr:unnamed protein product [Lactuca virosa]
MVVDKGLPYHSSLLYATVADLRSARQRCPSDPAPSWFSPKRGNEAYKSGDLSEAEVCYSKGISSIQHTETPGDLSEAEEGQLKICKIIILTEWNPYQKL